VPVAQEASLPVGQLVEGLETAAAVEPRADQYRGLACVTDELATSDAAVIQQRDVELVVGGRLQPSVSPARSLDVFAPVGTNLVNANLLVRAVRAALTWCRFAVGMVATLDAHSIPPVSGCQGAGGDSQSSPGPTYFRKAYSVLYDPSSRSVKLGRRIGCKIVEIRRLGEVELSDMFASFLRRRSPSRAS
jgi:hypothetical protein